MTMEKDKEMKGQGRGGGGGSVEAGGKRYVARPRG